MAGRQRDEERACSDKGKGKNKEEDTRAAEMDDLGSEVFNLKLALQEYEDRLSKLYQTEDRSKWKGPATLLIDLEVADREVDRLEHTVASLRDQLQEARGGSDGDSVGGGRDDSSGSTEGKSECTLLSTNTPGDQHEVDVEELRDQIAALEEDNRVLADAAGWELCEGSEGEDEDALVVPTGPSQRIRVIQALSSRMQDLTLLLDSALARENDARLAAEDALARMDDAVARTEELEASVLHYKRGKVLAEGRETALKSEMDELRARGDRDGGHGDGKAKAGVAVGVPARLTGREETSTKATGVNTEEGWPDVDAPTSDSLARLEADVLRWQETCERTNAQLRKERGLGEETAQRLAERETAVRELTKRLREAEKAAAAATAAAKAAIVETRGSPGVRQRQDHRSFERPSAGTLGDCDDSNVDGNHGTDDASKTNRRTREEQDQDEPSSAAADAAAEDASADASNDSFDSYAGPATSTASTDEDEVWKGRARASADTHKDAADPAGRKDAETGGASAEGGHTRTSSPYSPGRGRRDGDHNSLPVRKQKVAAAAAASGGAFPGENGYAEGGQAGRGGVGQQQQKQQLQRRPRWASQKHDMKHAGGGVGGPEQQQQSEEQHSIEELDLDPRPPGFPASSSRRRMRRSDVDVGTGDGFGDDDDDLSDIDDDELSTAECSAETTGGGHDAVGVSFDVASHGDGVSVDEEIEEGETQDSLAVDESGNQTPPQPRQGWERWHQHQRLQQQRTGSDGRRTEDGAEDSTSMQPLASVAGHVLARGGERSSATSRAESAARRAEASALRAERAAEIARVDRDGAELAAVEADAAVAAAQAALKIGGVPAPSHGYFPGANALRPQPATSRLQQHPLADVGEAFACQSESSSTDSRRAARLAERASLLGRLEALHAATEAERVARPATGRRGQVRTPFGGSTAAVDTPAPEGEQDAGDWWLEDGEVSADRLERVADVEPTSETGAGGSSTAGTGGARAPGRTEDVDYWNRPVAIAAAAAATKTSQRHSSRRHRTSDKASRSKQSVTSIEGRGAKIGRAARVEDAGDPEIGAAGPPDDRHRTSVGAPNLPTIPPPLSLLSVGRKRLAGVGVGHARAQGTAAVDATAAATEARRRRVLQHVEVGRGGEEHYRDAAKQRINPAEDGPLFGFDLGSDSSANAFGDGGGERFSAQRRRPASSENAVRQQGADKIVGGAAVGTGMARSSLRPKKKPVKKRKSRPAAHAVAHTAPLGGRQAMGYVHAHGALCARRCASPACPCGEPAAIAATSWRFRSGVVGTRR